MTNIDIIQKIIGYENELTDAERKVYRTVIDDPGVVTRFTISQIAMMADTSVAAVLRFCKHLGFRGYKDFRSEIMIWQRQNSGKRVSETDTVSSLAHLYSEAIGALSALDRRELNQ